MTEYDIIINNLLIWILEFLCNEIQIIPEIQ